MVEKGMKFTFNGKLAKALEYMPFVGLWFCVYEEDEGYFYLFPEEIEKSRKESDKNKMKLEYKFYEKNLAPKWLEGDYDLHIEGNRMVMTSKDGKKVETRCHPEDDWRLQIGIDELKERMAEAKKPREIKVGDIVTVKTREKYSSMEAKSFFEENDIPVEYIIRVVQANAAMTAPLIENKYRVLYIGCLSGKNNKKCALIESNVTSYLYVVNYSNLELVE